WAEHGAIHLVDGRRDRNDEGVAIGKRADLRREREPACGAQFLAGRFESGIRSPCELRDAVTLDIEADGRMMLAKLDGKRQSHVAKTDDADPRVVQRAQESLPKPQGLDLSTNPKRKRMQ